METNSTMYNLDIERAILSAIIFSPEIFEDIAPKLEPQDFYLPFHQHVFTAMGELSKKELPIDDLFIRKEIEKKSEFDEEAMLNISIANPISNHDAYIETIKDMTSKRKLKTLALEIQQGVNADSALHVLTQAEKSINNIKESASSSFLNIKNGNSLEDELPKFHLKHWLPIPQSALALISADGGVGKTWLSIQIAIRYVISHKFTKKAFLWLSEDPLGVVKSRLNDIISFLGMDKQKKEILSCIDFTDTEPPTLLVNSGYKKNDISPIFYTIKQQLADYSLLVFDPLIDFFGGDENSNSELGVFFKAFKGWVAEKNISCIFLHHHTKGGNGAKTTFRGGTAIRTSVRIAYEIDFCKTPDGEKDPKKKEYRAIKLTKDNWGGGNYLKFYLGMTKEYQLMPTPKFGDFEVVVKEFNDELSLPKGFI